MTNPEKVFINVRDIKQYKRAVSFIKRLYSVPNDKICSMPDNDSQISIVAYNTFNDHHIGRNNEYLTNLYGKSVDLTGRCFGLTKERPNTETKWMFHVNAEYQIDFERIADDLTADHPVALVRTPQKTYCVVRAKLAAKMHYSEGNREAVLMGLTRKEGMMPNGVVYEVYPDRLGFFLKFWKEIQTCRHGKQYRGKREVTVSLQSL